MLLMGMRNRTTPDGLKVHLQGKEKMNKEE